MTPQEFMDAYRTEYYFDNKPLNIKISSKPSFQQNSFESEAYYNNTKSLKEDIHSNSSGTDNENVDEIEDDTDVSDMETSVFEEKNNHTKQNPCTIQIMEHNDLQGTVAFCNQEETNKNDTTFTNHFKAEDIEFEESVNDDELYCS